LKLAHHAVKVESLREYFARLAGSESARSDGLYTLSFAADGGWRRSRNEPSDYSSFYSHRWMRRKEANRGKAAAPS
jgi:hypothetical protein